MQPLRCARRAHPPFRLAGLVILASVIGFACRGSSGAPPAATDHLGEAAPLPPRPARVLPGDFEPIEKVLIGWDPSDQLEPFFAEVVAELSRNTEVTILLGSDTTTSDVLTALEPLSPDASRIDFIFADSDSVWVRDFGPIVVREGQGRRAIDFTYFGDQRDDDFPAAFATLEGLPSSRIPLRFEGGNLLSDGTGRCLTTDIVFLDNQQHSVPEIYRHFETELGCKQLIVLPSMHEEDTGHVDMYAAVTGPGKVIVGRYTSEQDSVNAFRLDEAAAMLEAADFEVTRIPMPSNRDGIVRTYTNALPVNGALLIPVYPEDAAHEAEAIRILSAAYPGRTAIPIISSEIILQAGAIHCVAMPIAGQTLATPVRYGIR